MLSPLRAKRIYLLLLKFRKGWDDDTVNAIEFVIEMERVGASAIAVHGRTRNQMYTGKADWDIIREVKKNVSVPVIANGDVACLKIVFVCMNTLVMTLL